ncbi:hypothetical protein BC830DRAFT_1168376 [Chytriomyces sp. MP71]|nr:hypothetical protein BC830DRAFT_1168376 [Chytriomyces sp. MP71]
MAENHITDLCGDMANTTLRNSLASDTPSQLKEHAKTSVRSSVDSLARSGNGGDYWTISQGVAIRTGFSCRECKAVIMQGENVIVRDGRKMRFFYHETCYAGDPDPRTQPNSSFHAERFRDKIQKQAPQVKGRGKWSVASYGYNDNGVWK